MIARRMRATAEASRNGGDPSRPRYLQVADELTTMIGTGGYAVGNYLPTERDLCARFHVSRHTVREALRIIRDAGLISRRRRVGTEVVARNPTASYRQRTNSINDLLQYADETKIHVLRKTRVTCDDDLAAVLECNDGDEWIRVDSLRVVPGDPLPICLTTAYVSAELRNVEAELGTLDGPISAMLERVYGLRIARIDQTIEAMKLGARQAKLLRTATGSAALRAVRRYYDAKGRLIESSSALHPAQRFAYETSLVRETAGRNGARRPRA
ncbi:MAG: GntR family transcriptional regulator [Gemmatimonadota bacterium]|nr:GntR family transcriptional regulator [Gemmatimonadota bacterium]